MLNKNRLIDADDLIKIMRAEDIQYPNVPWSTTAVAKHCENLIVDAVEVVRCKDCKNYIYSSFAMGMRCKHDGVEWGKDDFCSYGERKDNDTKQKND